MTATMARPGPESNRRAGFSQGFCWGYAERLNQGFRAESALEQGAEPRSQLFPSLSRNTHKAFYRRGFPAILCADVRTHFQGCGAGL
jgi:hypothetical protein